MPTWQYQQVSGAAYEEADLVEEWCEERIGQDLTIHEASVEAMKWLREDVDATQTRQERLEDPQQRSAVRKEMRATLRSLK